LQLGQLGLFPGFGFDRGLPHVLMAVAARNPLLFDALMFRIKKILRQFMCDTLMAINTGFSVLCGKDVPVPSRL